MTFKCCKVTLKLHSLILTRARTTYTTTPLLQLLNMGNAPVKEVAQAAASTVSGVPVAKPKCKACCACPETKKVRDQCIIERGESECGDLIEAHKKCMRDQGFNI